ncbi:MAG: signal peptidase I [Rhabdochlamydiaceae bacterium]
MDEMSLIAGIMLLVIGIIGYVWASQYVEQSQTLQSWEITQIGSASIAAFGFGLLIYGAVAKPIIIDNFQPEFRKPDLRSESQPEIKSKPDTTSIPKPTKNPLEKNVKRFKRRTILKGSLIGIVFVVIYWILVGGLVSGTVYHENGTGMEPYFSPNDLIVKASDVQFENIKIGDVIIYHTPSDKDVIFVHRVIKILSENPRTLMTKGDATKNPLGGIDYPITKNEYVGKVAYVISQGGYFWNSDVLLITSGIIFVIPIIIMRRRAKRQFSHLKDYI